MFNQLNIGKQLILVMIMVALDPRPLPETLGACVRHFTIRNIWESQIKAFTLNV